MARVRRANETSEPGAMKRKFVSIDGDGVRHQLNRLIFSHDLDGVVALSASINEKVGEIAEWIRAHDGTLYALGGDNLLAQVADAPQLIDFVREKFHPPAMTFSIGVGDTPTLAELALRMAKSHAAGSVVEALLPEAGSLQFHTHTPM